MRSPPFTVNADALALIEEVFRTAEAKWPELINRVRTLGFAFSYMSSRPTPEGGCQITSRYSESHFHLGWHKKEVVDTVEFTEWELGGLKVVIHEKTLERLKGKKLVLEAVEVGYPNPADKTVRLLKAV